MSIPQPRPSASPPLPRKGNPLPRSFRSFSRRGSRFPWLLLVPEREDVREIAELSPVDRAELIEEIARASGVLTRLFQPDKLNVGALGNVIPQLHVHVVARFSTDPAWPGPVWDSGPAVPYGESELAEIRDRLAAAFLDATEESSLPKR